MLCNDSLILLTLPPLLNATVPVQQVLGCEPPREGVNEKVRGPWAPYKAGAE